MRSAARGTSSTPLSSISSGPPPTWSTGGEEQSLADTVCTRQPRHQKQPCRDINSLDVCSGSDSHRSLEFRRHSCFRTGTGGTFDNLAFRACYAANGPHFLCSSVLDICSRWICLAIARSWAFVVCDQWKRSCFTPRTSLFTPKRSSMMSLTSFFTITSSFCCCISHADNVSVE